MARKEKPRAPPPQIERIDVLIRGGEALSDAVDCSQVNVLNIAFDEWEPIAQITFQISADGETFYNLFWENGQEIVMTVWPNTAYVVTGAWRDSIRWLKIRSGVHNGPVPQTADRIIKLGAVA